jgi:L-idonate 5-dehydrogenase
VSQTEMQAAVVQGRGHVTVESRPVPEPGPGDVRVRVLAAGICGSDLHLHHTGLYAPGTIPGHEFMGEVDALGSDATGFSVGERVAIEPFRTCGRCSECRSGRDSICREARLLGVHEPGGFAGYAVAPARRLFRLPSGLEPRHAALAEPMAVCVHGLRRGAMSAGQRVLVLGSGSIGLLSVLAARALGAAEVWATARHPHQARLAARLGASRVLSEDEADPARLDALGRDAPIDLVVETVGGQADTLVAAGAAARPGGVVSVVGFFLGPPKLDPMPLLLKEVTLAWAYCYHHPEQRADFDDAIEILHGARQDLDPLLTHSLPLEEIDQAYALAGDKRSGVIKVSIFPS